MGVHGKVSAPWGDLRPIKLENLWPLVFSYILQCFFFSDVHTLYQYCTATQGIKDFPNYTQTDIVDDKVFSYYDSTQSKVPLECMRSHLDPQFWNWSIDDTMGRQQFLTKCLQKIEGKNQTGECVHTYIYSYTCIHTCGHASTQWTPQCSIGASSV